MRVPSIRRTRAVRTRHVRQAEEADCGAACLAAVLAWHGRHVPLPELRAVCGGGRDGLTAATLVRAAGHYGLRGAGKRVRLTGDDSVDVRALRGLPAPAILFVDGNHFVVLDEVTEPGEVRLNDPATGRRRMAVAEFRAHFSGIALVFAPAPGFTPGGEPERLRHQVRAWLRPHRGLLAAAALAGVLASLAALGAAFLLRALMASQAGPAHRTATWPLWAMGGAALAVLAAGWLQNRLQSALLTSVSAERSREFVHTLLHLPLAFFQRRFTGGIAARVQLADTLANQLTALAVSVAGAGVTLLVMAGALVWLAPAIALLVFTGTAIAVFLSHRSAADEEERQGRVLAEQAVRDGELMGGLGMLDTLKAEAGTARLLDRWQRAHARGLLAERDATAAAQRAHGTTTAVHAAVSVGAVILGAFEVRHGRLPFADLMAVITLSGVFQASAGTLGGSALRAGALRGSFAAYTDAVGADAGARDADVPGVPGPLRADGSGAPAGRLVVRDLVFGYDINRPPLLEGVGFTLEPGERLVVVGASGSAKSTLARLLVGAGVAWSGAVALDGTDARRLPPGTVGYVSQHPVFFEGTVAENVAFGDPDIPAELVDEALRTACLDEVVARRGGPGTARVAAGAQNFSGGERQRLALARALCRRPALLVLDEATSALETPLAARVDARLRAGATTTVSVAHRLDTVHPDDLVLLLDAGRPVEYGRHRELAGDRGAYRTLLEAGR
ncbi:cysteine peptidase family C39 domain-containing protein [Kitasatospora sp. NPDC093558]|uniref:peptidase domain-containing ABC transporter n=1 Tax=Kitasatospora sp. NPDC093558 TaxID=3155201 RepID=UPI0034174614